MGSPRGGGPRTGASAVQRPRLGCPVGGRLRHFSRGPEWLWSMTLKLNPADERVPADQVPHFFPAIEEVYAGAPGAQCSSTSYFFRPPSFLDVLAVILVTLDTHPPASCIFALPGYLRPFCLFFGQESCSAPNHIRHPAYKPGSRCRVRQPTPREPLFSITPGSQSVEIDESTGKMHADGNVTSQTFLL